MDGGDDWGRKYVCGWGGGRGVEGRAVQGRGGEGRAGKGRQTLRTAALHIMNLSSTTTD